MSDNANATSGAGDSSSGESKSLDIKSSSGDGTYPKDFVDKLKREKENLVKSKSALEEQVSSLLKEKQSREESELQSQNKYKELYESHKAKVETLEKELNSTRETIIEGKKNSAIRTELVKLGLDETHIESAFKLLDKKTVQFDPQTGVVIGADDAAKAFHQNYGSLGFFKKQTMTGDHSAPASGPGQVDLSKLSSADKIKMLVSLKK